MTMSGSMPSHGGNGNFDTGQITLSGSAQQIPVPKGLTTQGTSPYAANAFKIQSAILYITPGSYDLYYGNSANVTTATGHRLPAGPTNGHYPLTCCRTPIWIIGTANDVVTFSWEWNGN